MDMGDSVLVFAVAMRDAQAATSPANRIAHARTKQIPDDGRERTTARSGDIGAASDHSEKHEGFGCPHGSLRSRQSADPECKCGVEDERSDVGERCGHA